MRPLNRGGTTLVELLVALSLTAYLGLMGAMLVRGAANAANRASLALAEQTTARTLGALLRHELSQGVDGEIRRIDPTAIAFYRPIGDAVICRTEVNAVVVAQADWRGSRLPDPARDRMSLLPTATELGWMAAVPTLMSATHCLDGRPAWRISTMGNISSSYLFVDEPVQLMAYRSGVADWFGLAPGDGSASVQPLAGPLLRSSTTFEVMPGSMMVRGRHAAGASFQIGIPLAPQGPSQ